MMRKLTTLLAIVAALALLAPAALAAPTTDRSADPLGAEARPTASPSIVDVAVAVNEETGEFSTLLSLVTRYPDIVELLSSKGQYTVFAPTDAAFAALFEEVDPASLSTETVKDILLYHVAHGERDAAAVTSSTRIRMLNGGFAQVDGATIVGANIVITDVPADNGVIHVVDGVLLP